jgi:hypothetical protein
VTAPKFGVLAEPVIERAWAAAERSRAIAAAAASLDLKFIKLSLFV